MGLVSHLERGKEHARGNMLHGLDHVELAVISSRYGTQGGEGRDFEIDGLGVDIVAVEGGES